MTSSTTDQPTVNDPKGAAGALKAPMWLLPPSALEQTAWVHKLGAEKYGPYNWRDTGVCATTYVSAIMRHLGAWRDGQDLDPESGFSHIAHIATSCNILMDALACGTLQDDRNKRPGVPKVDEPAVPSGVDPDVVARWSELARRWESAMRDRLAAAAPDEDEEIARLYAQTPESGITIDGRYRPFPEVPAGFLRWEYRGLGWDPGRRRVRYAFWDRFGGEWESTFNYPMGGNTHYLEAIPQFGLPGDRVLVDPLHGPAFEAVLENFVDVRGFAVYKFRRSDGCTTSLHEDGICSVRNLDNPTTHP